MKRPPMDLAKACADTFAWWTRWVKSWRRCLMTLSSLCEPFKLYAFPEEDDKSRWRRCILEMEEPTPIVYICLLTAPRSIYIISLWGNEHRGLDAVNCTDGQLSFTERVAYQYHLLKLHVRYEIMMDIDRHRLMYFDIYLPLMNVLIPLYIQFMNYWYPNEKSEEPQKPQDTKKTDLKY